MTTAQQPAPTLRAGQTRNLVLATLAFAITFWAWNLIAPLGVFYASPGEMDLNASQKSILIAVPILVGSLGRIVVGVLTPRFGGRVMFTALLLLSVPFVILVAVAGELKSYPLMIVIGFFLGIAGTSFAAGIPFLNNWYEPARRGFATGVFGAGMGGTALSAFFTPRFKEWFGYFPTHIIIAGALIVVAAVWKQISYNFLFFLAGLQSIPKSLIEAAAIDGASPWRRFWTIVFPLLSPTTFFLLVINVVYAFFDTIGIIDAATQGGPGQSTSILVYKVYQDGFKALDLGGSAAQSVILMLIVVVLTVIQFRYVEKKVQY